MPEPLTHPLPIYPSFLSKADAIAAEAKADPNRVIGGIVRLWLYAELNGQPGLDKAMAYAGPQVVGLDRYTAAELAGSGEVVMAMERRGWIVFDLTGATFPGLKGFAAAQPADPPTGPEADRRAWFEPFWRAYRAKDGQRGPKHDALREWLRIKGMDAALAERITQAAAAQADAGWPMFHGKNPHARRWLHNRMWEDDTTDTTAPQAISSPDGPKNAERSRPDQLTSWAEKMRQTQPGA